VTLAVPATLVFCVEVAVTVTEVIVVTEGAVNKPVEEIVPALVVHVTPVLKLPVPFTVAEHWLVPPELTVVGEQLTVTDVTVEPDDPPLPPQAAITITLPNTSNSPNLRTITRLSPSANIAGLNALRH
jgi:hypothetical protein